MQSLKTTRPRGPRKHLQRSALVVAAWSTSIALVAAQARFNPPPIPTSTPSAVRGISSQTIPNRSPATLAPEPTTPDPRPTPSSLLSGTPSGSADLAAGAAADIRPVEGGQIVARIDGQVVLASDVLWQVDQLIAANRDRIPTDKLEEVKRTLLRQQVMGLMDTKMLYADFRRKVPAENLPGIQDNLATPFEDQEVPRLVKMFELKDRGELDALLRQSGTSIADIQRQFIERTIAGEWLRQMIPKPKEVSHQAMLDYYNAHKNDFEFLAKAKWEEVVIRFDRSGGDRAAAWKTITQIGNEVWQSVSEQPGLRGPVFTDIAQEKSHGFNAQQGGQHDWTTQGAMRCSEIDEALFSLRVGQLSNVIESESGFHIVRVLERQEAGCVPFTEAQAKIREALNQDQRKDLADEVLTKLRKKSRVWTLFDGDLSGSQLAQKMEPSQRQ